MAKDIDRKYSVQVINIKLQTDKEGDEKTKAYEMLFKRLVRKKILESIGENKAMIIYSYYESGTSKNVRFLYGYISKGIYFDKDEVNTLSIEKSENVKTKSDRDSILAPKTNLYIFIPSIHKFCLIHKQDEYISINEVYRFLKTGIEKIRDEEDIVEIEIVKEPGITDEILNAFAIQYLDYTISYTNDDPTSSQMQLFDNRLKKIQAGNAHIQLKADHHGELNKDEPDELIEGGIRLAEMNGTINEAVIKVSEKEKWIKVSNKKSPRVIIIQAFENTFKETIVSKIYQIFQNLL